jgi:large subunit ribosomal protein L30
MASKGKQIRISKQVSGKKVPSLKGQTHETENKLPFDTHHITKRFAVVRIRGINDVRPEIRVTLEMLNLRRIHNLTFIDDRASYKGMLQKSKDYITWGEPTAEIVAGILKKWGRLPGNKKLTDAYIKQHTTFQSIDEFAKAFIDLKVEIRVIPDLKPFFRLHPPRYGFRGKGIKYAYNSGGALGYRSTEINDLIQRMSGI